MTQKMPFGPAYGSGKNLTATTTSQNVTIKPGNKQLRIGNKGTSDVWIRAYSSVNAPGTVATTADFWCLAGLVSTLTIDETYDTVAYITDTGTAAFKLMTGEGF